MVPEIRLAGRVPSSSDSDGRGGQRPVAMLVHINICSRLARRALRSVAGCGVLLLWSNEDDHVGHSGIVAFSLANGDHGHLAFLEIDEQAL